MKGCCVALRLSSIEMEAHVRNLPDAQFARAFCSDSTELRVRHVHVVKSASAGNDFGIVDRDGLFRGFGRHRVDSDTIHVTAKACIQVFTIPRCKLGVLKRNFNLMARDASLFVR